MADIRKLASIALPATREDLIRRKDMAGQPTLNDHVDRAHVALWDNPDYRAFLDAVYDEDAREGSLSTDNVMAGQMIKQWAVTNADIHLKDRKIATLVKSLNVVLKRYHMSRKERANMLGGEIVGGAE